MHVRVRTALFFYSFNFNRGCGGVDYSRTFVVYSRTCGVYSRTCGVSGNTFSICSSTPSIMDRCWLDNGPMERNEIRAVRSGFGRGFIELSPRFLAKKLTIGKVQRKVHKICEISCI